MPFVPIILTTYERPEYFKKTMDSLESSGVCLKGFLNIFDDNSKDLYKIDLLNHYKKKYNVVVSDENLGTVRNTLPNFDWMYKTYGTDFVMLQDDVILSKGWLKKGFDIWMKRKYKTALLSLFNRTGKRTDEINYLPVGHPGGVAWIVSVKFWALYREKYDVNDYCIDKLVTNDQANDYKVKNLVDFKLAKRANSMGWVTAFTGQSLVQHIGDNSSLHNLDMTEHRSPVFVGEK